MPKFLAVHAAEYVQQVSAAPFIGLPREELERLHDAVPVLALDHPEPACLPLVAYAVVHYNYSWLIGLDSEVSLGKRVALHAAGEPPLFLDDALHALARARLEAAGLPSAPCEWRCAGLSRAAGQLALVYVVRLRQRWVEGSVLGNGELRAARTRFDALSQQLIDHLDAL